MHKYFPSLLSMKDIYRNDLDISIQKKVITFKSLEQNLTVDTFFLIHRWEPDKMEYSLYSEEALKKLHIVFGHTHVLELHNLLKRAYPHKNTKI